MYWEKNKKKKRDERERGAWDGVSGKRQLEAKEKHNDLHNTPLLLFCK